MTRFFFVFFVVNEYYHINECELKKSYTPYNNKTHSIYIQCRRSSRRFYYLFIVDCEFEL